MTLIVGFDLDLTLVDSRERVLTSYVAAFADLGDPVAASELEPLLGLPLTVTATRLRPHLDQDELVRRYRHHYDVGAAEAPHAAMPGAREALQAVHAHGGRSVVISAKYGPAVDLALTEAGLADLVDRVHAERFAEGKTHALQQEGAGIYVGDHVEDMKSAVRAGAVGVGVATGAFDAAALRAAGATTALASMADFPAYLDGRR
ncbi:HAD hydrolase-like protein [Arsenicicoccus piscis]|uniref:Hydrolase n=1 Tax=Arsenicicoccus piscis TaxID=673954 RepID=A0ABQ6HM64_9MICO|nr:HAD hydrolase-like protein [Arsenicicoccus piscis]MCH8628946.1 HAD hydrolase-like protein [Arsenicicoccus piscis]GMA19556.1 hydrolase [Arsenicicoccus piscis]